jgi:hypothetical protein
MKARILTRRSRLIIRRTRHERRRPTDSDDVLPGRYEREREIADSLKLSLFVVYEVLTAFDWEDKA